VLGYWYPEEQGNFITGNDTITVGASASNPVLAHTFLNFFQDPKYAIPNFEDWNGYQPPQRSIDPGALVNDKVVPATLSQAIVKASDVTRGQFINVLSAEDDQRWVDAWAEIKAGG
jgi:spermidine/putrescine transport system substrate-binding protein